jgi:hypothetical protein
VAAVREFLDLCRESTVDSFCRERPHPVLLHDVTVRPLTPIRVKSPTVDRLMIGQELAVPPPSVKATITHLANRSQTERAAPAIGEGFQVFVLASKTNSPQISVGSDGTCDVQITDASISAIHAIIERRGNTFLLRDNDSTAGTQLNDKPLETGKARPLSTGDRITLGFVDFTLLLSPDFYHFVRRLYGI